MRKTTLFLAACLTLAACGGSGDDSESKETKKKDGEAVAELPDKNPYPSTYIRYPSEDVVITGATVLTGTGTLIENGAVVLHDGKVAAVGAADEVDIPDGAETIDAAGQFVTPGIIDIHSHLGVYPAPSVSSTSDGNEASSPNTAGVWAEHSIWPQDPGFNRALAGGITSLMILPGSANLFGGRTVTIKNVPGRTVQEMKFPDAPYGLKMACGENPKRVYGKSGPSTRMGNFRGYRDGWIDAAAYKKKWDDYAEKIEDGEDADPPSRDLKLETLAMALDGEVRVHMHCYRADEMAQVIDMSEEFGYEISSFQHAVEAYKVADLLAENGTCAAMWADWWGFKLEAYDGVRENAALVAAQSEGCAIIHSDSDVGIQRLNQETAKAMADGNAIGLNITPEEAITWITANPAKAMGILDQTGTLEVGKMGDVVIWSGDPFSVYSQAEKVFIDGALMYDRNDPNINPRSDFELGQLGQGPNGGAGK